MTPQEASWRQAVYLEGRRRWMAEIGGDTHVRRPKGGRPRASEPVNQHVETGGEDASDGRDPVISL